MPAYKSRTLHEITDKKEVDWREIGHDVAVGKKGTGWMRFDFDKMIAKEIVEKREGSTDLESAVLSWSEGWKETEQFKYEVGDAILKEAQRIGGKDWIENYAEMLSDYFLGYAEAAVEILKRKKMKTLKSLESFAKASAKKRLKEVV